MSLGSRLIASIVAVVAMCSAAFAADHLTTLRILSYTALDDGTNKGEVVRMIIRDSIGYLSDHFLPPAPAYLYDLSVSDDAEERVTSANLHRYWADPDHPSLAVLLGQVDKIGPDNLKVAMSTIYLGDLPALVGKPAFPTKVVVPLELRIREYSEMADSHAFVTCYALLLDAKRTGVGPDALLSMVQTCRDIFKDLARRGGETADLVKVNQAIEDTAKQASGAQP